MRMEKRCIAIAGIHDTTDYAVRVVLPDGHTIWLPRSVSEFYPGKVFIPQWLAVRLANFLPACSTVKAPARATGPPVVVSLHPEAQSRRDAQR